MATTKKIYESLDFCKKMIKDMPLEDVFFHIAQDVSDFIWVAAPWKWTVGLMPVVTLASNTSDYTVAIPADYLMVEQAWLVSSNSKESPRAISPVSIIPASASNISGQPSVLWVYGTPGEDGTMRVAPRPGTITGTNQIHAIYKLTAPIINKADVYLDTLASDDEWFGVFREGCLWKSFLYADDSRAGGSQVMSNGQTQYSGQRAVFQDSLNNMLTKEERLLADTRQFLDQKQ